MKNILKMYTKFKIVLVIFCTLPTILHTSHISQELLREFIKPVPLNRNALKTFFINVFNHQSYGTHCLPASFRHAIDFLSYNKQVKNPLDYTVSIFDLFHDRLKESTWVNPYALTHLLNAVNEHTATLLQEPKIDRHDLVKQTIYNALLTQFAQLKNDPDTFITTLTDNIFAIVDDPEKQQRAELQHALIRLIESALDKVIWDPSEQEDCWDSCKLLAEQLDTMHRLAILPNETILNHCYWSLIYRFSYFIETTGEHLSPAVYRAIKNDILLQQIPLLTLAEQEEHILTKAQRLHTAVFEGEVKVQAAKTGFAIR